MNSLVQIDASIVPPTHQSTENIMGCKKNYVTQVIEGRKSPGGVESLRGKEIHHVMAQYLSHCARKEVSVDLAAFDVFAHGAGIQASKILAGVRDYFQVDWKHLFATELSMRLDEDFMPTDLALELDGMCGDSGNDPGYEGTLDGLFLFRKEKQIGITDFKSHPRPYDPAKEEYSIQGKTYSLYCFQHFPWVQEVKFSLVFVRFTNVIREVTYTREDIPKLIEAVKSSRNRQKQIHKEYMAGMEMEAVGNDGCFYCPLLPNAECPLAEVNPRSTMSRERRLSLALFYKNFATVNSQLMREDVQSTGRSIILKDYNGKAFRYGPEEREATVYPLFRANGKDKLQVDHRGNPVMPIIELLLDHVHSAPEDIGWLSNLSISGTKLKSYLGAKKRVLLDGAVQDALRVSKPLDSETLEEEFDEDEENEEEF